ncbi:MAG: hypothetical protein JWO86_5020 [Myxococcaceae bacterium]|jgi:hypothetical protein|nr:hypothetical protein [Myxococcaceae bacterium]MEA2748137.1 hypothetical protein [Myxococcales bacterium]
MLHPRLFLLAVCVSFCPACGGCGHDKVVIKEDRKPAPTVVVQQPVPVPVPATTQTSTTTTTTTK